MLSVALTTTKTRSDSLALMPIQWTPQAGSSHARHAIAPNRNVQGRCRSPPEMARPVPLGAPVERIQTTVVDKPRSRVERSQALEVTCTLRCCSRDSAPSPAPNRFHDRGQNDWEVHGAVVRIREHHVTDGLRQPTGDHDMPLPRNTTSSCRCRSGAPRSTTNLQEHPESTKERLCDHDHEPSAFGATLSK